MPAAGRYDRRSGIQIVTAEPPLAPIGRARPGPGSRARLWARASVSVTPDRYAAAFAISLFARSAIVRRMSEPEPERETHFGFHSIPEAEKGARVHGVFSSVAARYDLMNDLMSGRLHRLWKAAMIDWLAPRPGMECLDLAGGTGDIAFRIQDRCSGQASITICDLTEAMLLEGRRRAATKSYGGVEWVAGDAMALPFPDGAFDTVTIAFGIRNVARIETALAEARRVLRFGGRFLCLEFSHVSVPVLARAYERYSFAVIPRLGRAVTGDRASYQYLVESIRRFPDQASLAELIGAAGFDRVAWRDLSFGVVALHSGWRL